MTENEKAVNEALSSEPLIVELKPSNRKKKFTDMTSFGKFIDGEVEYWTTVPNLPQDSGAYVFNALKTARSELQNARTTLPNDPNSTVRYLRSSRQQLEQLLLFSETTEGRFLREQLSSGLERFLGGLYFLIPNMPVKAGAYSQEFLRGFVEAHFRFQANPSLWSKDALATFEQQQQTLDSNFADIQERFTKVTTELGQGSAALGEQFRVISTDLDTFRDQWKQEIETVHKSAVDRAAELESLYGEKLRLKGPAEYWQGLTRRYRNSGIVWSVVSGVLAITGSIAGIWGLDFFQQALKTGQSVIPGSTAVGTDWTHIVPVTIVFGVIISVWIFLVRTTVRLALSGFHLVRDAVEREQLSHYYLALIAQDKTLDKEAQTIVLQSLFSRAETGLLKGESGPTMPGNLAEILKNLRS